MGFFNKCHHVHDLITQISYDEGSTVYDIAKCRLCGDIKKTLNINHGFTIQKVDKCGDLICKVEPEKAPEWRKKCSTCGKTFQGSCQ